MQSTHLLPALDDLPDEIREALLSDRTLRSLADVLAAIPDPRSCHGKRYDLPMLLTCLVAALLCGCNSLEAVGTWCQYERPLLRRLFGPRKHLTPSGSLYRWLLPRLDAAHLEWALSGWILTTRPLRDHEAVALDGKALCGTGEDRATQRQVLSVSTHASGETLIQLAIAAKTSEIPAAQAVLPWLLLDGRVVTADALHCQTATAHIVLDGGADYLLCVKGNQHTLARDIVDLFVDPATRCTTASTVDRQHGRREERTARATTDLNAHIRGFPAVGQVVEITRTVTDKRGTRTDLDYFITSLTPRQAPPERLLALVRAHWSIETRHYLRDVVFGEDRSQIRTGAAPQILAALRNAILTLLRRSGRSAVTAARRELAAHPARALALISRRFPARR